MNIKHVDFNTRKGKMLVAIGMVLTVVYTILDMVLMT